MKNIIVANPHQNKLFSEKPNKKDYYIQGPSVPENKTPFEHENGINLRLWFYNKFVISQPGHGIMNPEWQDERYVLRDEKGQSKDPGKYNFRKAPLTLQDLDKAFDNIPREFKKRPNQLRKPPPTLWSFAIVPMHIQKEWATFSIADLDSGGEKAVQEALTLCCELGLWAFVQTSESTSHQGGHLWIPCSQQLPAAVLRALAERIKSTLPFKIDAYPTNNLIRLPIMPHLRHPSGVPTRLPIITADSAFIDTTDPNDALYELCKHWKENSPEQITAALEALISSEPKAPSLSPPPRKNPPHRSRIQTSKDEKVIDWYLQTHDLRDELNSLGVHVTRSGAYTCPWHEDKTPSLYVHFHENKGQWVCNCLSRNSGCQAQIEGGHYDAFNLYCDEYNLTASEAVKQIVEENGLGRGSRRPPQRIIPTALPNTDTLEEHLALVDQKRGEIRGIIRDSINHSGSAQIIAATPGSGKSTIGAEEAIRLHQQGKRIAVSVYSTQAAQDWEKKLGKHGYRWRPRTALCTCYKKDGIDLEGIGALGYTLPPCIEPNCPYEQQKLASKGKIVIYQFNHTFLMGGELLLHGGNLDEDPLDLLILDENPVGSLLQETTSFQSDLRQLLKKIPDDDPAVPLISALIAAGTTIRKDSERTVINVLDEQTSQNTYRLVQDAKRSNYAKISIKLSQKKLRDVDSLPPAFLGKMVQALSHDVEKGRSDLLHFSQDQTDRRWRWSWYKKNIPLEKSPSLPGLRPALCILDGSANEEIYKRLLPGWKIEMHPISIPFSPRVRLIQFQYAPNTRAILKDGKLQILINQVAYELNELQMLCDGGISYLAATETLQKALGGDWMHYGGQRGRNSLRDATCSVILSAPTLPPAAIERQARAIFCDDDDPIDAENSKRENQGFYRAADSRLQCVQEMLTLHELFQSLHRPRPILAEHSQTILLFSTWDLSAQGIQPHEVRSLRHGNDNALQNALTKYQDRLEVQRKILRGLEQGIGLKGEERAICTNGRSELSSPLPPALSNVLAQGPSSVVPESEWRSPICSSVYANRQNLPFSSLTSRNSSNSKYGGKLTEETSECVGCGCYFESSEDFQTCEICRPLYGEEVCEDFFQEFLERKEKEFQ